MRMNNKLTRKEYWDSIYEPKKHRFRKNLSCFILKRLEKTCLRNYADYFLWEVIYKKYMPRQKGAKLLEIGSSPGNNLIRLNRKFGFIPYGIEYSANGVELNKKVFAANGIDTDNVIFADFFSKQIQK